MAVRGSTTIATGSTIRSESVAETPSPSEASPMPRISSASVTTMRSTSSAPSRELRRAASTAVDVLDRQVHAVRALEPAAAEEGHSVHDRHVEIPATSLITQPARDVPAPARADLDRIGFQSFRHTCASVLLDSGKNNRQEAPCSDRRTRRSPYAPTPTGWMRVLEMHRLFSPRGPSTRSSRARPGSARVDAVNVDAVRAMVACELKTPDRPQRAQNQTSSVGAGSTTST
jgi:hypothetical protein